MALEVMKLIFAVLDVSFNSGRYTVIIKRLFLYIILYGTATAFPVLNYVDTGPGHIRRYQLMEHQWSAVAQTLEPLTSIPTDLSG